MFVNNVMIKIILSNQVHMDGQSSTILVHLDRSLGSTEFIWVLVLAWTVKSQKLSTGYGSAQIKALSLMNVETTSPIRHICSSAQMCFLVPLQLLFAWFMHWDMENTKKEAWWWSTLQISHLQTIFIKIYWISSHSFSSYHNLVTIQFLSCYQTCSKYNVKIGSVILSCAHVRTW